jgi:hypothetical protein
LLGSVVIAPGTNVMVSPPGMSIVLARDDRGRNGIRDFGFGRSAIHIRLLLRLVTARLVASADEVIE